MYFLNSKSGVSFMLNNVPFCYFLHAVSVVKFVRLSFSFFCMLNLWFNITAKCHSCSHAYNCSDTDTKNCYLFFIAKNSQFCLHKIFRNSALSEEKQATCSSEGIRISVNKVRDLRVLTTFFPFDIQLDVKKRLFPLRSVIYMLALDVGLLDKWEREKTIKINLASA